MSRQHLERPRNKIKSAWVRAQVRDGLAAGKSLSAIAKDTGQNYAYIKTIAAQEALAGEQK